MLLVDISMPFRLEPPGGSREALVSFKSYAMVTDPSVRSAGA
jgi:hypothetical protein